MPVFELQMLTWLNLKLTLRDFENWSLMIQMEIGFVCSPGQQLRNILRSYEP
jgi:hypothetical protein